MSPDALKVVVELAVGDAPSHVSLADAGAIAAAAERSGVTAIRLVDHVGENGAVDPSVIAAHLAGRYADIGWLIDTPTTHNAPYNVARRVLSIDRATGGRAGVVLLPGVGDEVSDAADPDPAATDPADRWEEYARILIRLWESFPAAALVGDQEGAVVADDTLIRPVDFDGRFYRVAGPLDGPSSVQGRPVLVATQPASLGWSRVASVADVVIVDGNEIDCAGVELEAALDAMGRSRDDVALLARIDSPDAVPKLAGVDGIVVAIDGGAPAILDAIRAVAPRTSPGRRPTLRAELAVPHPEGALS
ncbi:LLM class flavin-dependent oxidoreductase [Mycobacterium hodleri]|uniref:LLM class flavin-dependent oxidoreductase n=1 Tax=Mycolicibacterium hodleri TaxID=49897 RepID=UPI0021F2FF56|nr:LLM class flavin-dependent oxidoreductase [Mycolicibacterium hodleri]MCV7134601.1 LLM class flavin-dependent oxidoreductase [Mycolicibacterium hodleri]